MEEKRSKSSLFSGILGIAALFSLAAAASYFQAWQAASFFFLLLFLCGSSFLWSRRVLKQIEVSVKALAGEGYTGDRLSLEINVRNNSFFPLTWLDVLLPTGTRELVCQTSAGNVRRYQLEGWREAQTGIRLRFAWLLWQQEIRWTEELTALRRGAAVLEGASLQAGDGLGLSAREAVFCIPDGEEPEMLLKQAMEALAKVDYRAEEPHFPYEEFWQAGHKLGNVHICTRTDEASGLDGLAEGLGRSRARYLVLERQARAAGEFECLYEDDICLERLDWGNMEKEVLVGRCMRDGGSNETDH